MSWISKLFIDEESYQKLEVVTFELKALTNKVYFMEKHLDMLENSFIDLEVKVAKAQMTVKRKKAIAKVKPKLEK